MDRTTDTISLERVMDRPSTLGMPASEFRLNALGSKWNCASGAASMYASLCAWATVHCASEAQTEARAGNTGTSYEIATVRLAFHTAMDSVMRLEMHAAIAPGRGPNTQRVRYT